MGYSSAKAYIVIVMVALADELLASVRLVVISLSGMLLSAGEALASGVADADDPPISPPASLGQLKGLIPPFIPQSQNTAD